MRAKIGPALGFGAFLLALWWLVSVTGAVDSAFLPSPYEAASRMIAGLAQGYLATAAWVTLQEALFGCLLAGLVGIPLGYLVGKSRLSARVLQPYLAGAQAIPGVALAPLLTIWIGYGTGSIVTLCAIMVVFPVIINSAMGVAHIDRDVLGAARLDGASGFTLVRHIELPLAAPSILAGLRTGFTLSVTGAVVGEMIIGGKGLGMLLTSAQASADVKGMFAVIILLAASAMLIYGFLVLVERRANYLIRS